MIEIYSIRKHFMENIHLTTETREQILRHVSEMDKISVGCSVLRTGRGSCLWNSYVTSRQNSQ